MLKRTGIWLLLFLFACGQKAIYVKASDIINPDGKDIVSRFNVPEGYQRVKAEEGSFGYYLRYFSLKPHGTKVYYYNGEEKSNSGVYDAVLDIDVGKKDLQQCADAVMRLRAEYLYTQKLYDYIHFNFTSGFNAVYNKWAEGYRIRVSGNNVSWYASSEKDYGRETFKKYLETVFTYAGTRSLSAELKTVSLENIQVGDVFIHGGSPGHAVIVVDVAENIKTGKKIFMIAQSYMPAQDIHILKNLKDPAISPWYDISEWDELYSPEWTFGKDELKRF